MSKGNDNDCNKHRGPTLDSFLEEEGVLAEFQAKAIEEAMIAIDPKVQIDNEVVLAPRGPKGRPQVKRERANRLIDALIDEAEQINTDPLAWYDVTRLSVFGSYLASKPVLTDLDIAVRMTPRWLPDTDGFTRAWQSFSLACPAPNHIARDPLSLIHWPRLYILRRLKRVGRGISVHSQHDLDSCGFEHRVIFEKPEEELFIRK